MKLFELNTQMDHFFVFVIIIGMGMLCCILGVVTKFPPRIGVWFLGGMLICGIIVYAVGCLRYLLGQIPLS